MTFHLNLRRIKLTSEKNPLDKLTNLQNEAEKALSVIEHAESENDNSSIAALSHIFAFHHEAHSSDANFEIFRKMCLSKSIKVKTRKENDYSSTLSMLIGGNRKLKSKKSRWKGALLHADSKDIKPKEFKPAILEENEGIVAWSNNWYRSVKPDQTRRNTERDQKFINQYAEVILRPENVSLGDMIEGKEAVFLQKRHGKVMLFEARHLSPSEVRRVLIRSVPPKK